MWYLLWSDRPSAIFHKHHKMKSFWIFEGDYVYIFRYFKTNRLYICIHTFKHVHAHTHRPIYVKIRR